MSFKGQFEFTIYFKFKFYGIILQQKRKKRPLFYCMEFCSELLSQKTALIFDIIILRNKDIFTTNIYVYIYYSRIIKSCVRLNVFIAVTLILSLVFVLFLCLITI